MKQLDQNSSGTAIDVHVYREGERQREEMRSTYCYMQTPQIYDWGMQAGNVPDLRHSVKRTLERPE